MVAFILLLEETQETTLLLSFLRTLICYDRNTLGKFFAEFYLLSNSLEILNSWISFSAINTRRLSIRSPGIVILELTKDAIHLEAFGTIEELCRLFPIREWFHRTS